MAKLIVVLAGLVTVGLLTATFVVGILYIPKVSNYFRNANINIFFAVRRKYLIWALIINLLFIPLILVFPFIYLLDVLGYWQGTILAPIIINMFVSYIVSLLANLYILNVIVFKKQEIGTKLNDLLREISIFHKIHYFSTILQVSYS